MYTAGTKYMEEEGEPVALKPTPLCKLALRFLKPTTLYERMVARIARSPVHVDIVVDKPGTSHKAVCYSAFMRERFSMTLMDQQCMSNPSYENRYMDISEDEADKCLAYLSKLTGKVGVPPLPVTEQPTVPLKRCAGSRCPTITRTPCCSSPWSHTTARPWT